MTYWGSYEDQLRGGYDQRCDPEYVQQYYNSMSYYNQQNRFTHHGPNSNDYDAQRNFMEQPGSSSNQVTDRVYGEEAGTSSQNCGTGAVKKKPNNNGRYWNNGRKNERYGSGRTVSRPPKPEFEHNRTFGDDGRYRNKFNNHQQNRYKNNYNDRRNYNNRSRDGYDNRSGEKYGKYYENSDFGATGSEHKNWRNNAKRCNPPAQRKRM